MALSLLSRRLLSPTAAAAARLPSTFPMVAIHSPNSSTASASEPNPGAPTTPTSPDEMRHQEIEGPTVERDTSPLAYETRGELDALRRNVQRLSGSLALLGGAHLAGGAWIAYGAPPLGVESAAAVQGATKNVNLMLLRTRVMAIACALGVSVASVAAILMR
nr:unnamed protein product [Digitaria exilis]